MTSVVTHVMQAPRKRCAAATVLIRTHGARSAVLAILLIASWGSSYSSAQEEIPAPPPSQSSIPELTDAEQLPLPEPVPDAAPPLAPEQLPVELPRCERVRALMQEIAAERDRLDRQRALALQREAVRKRTLPQPPAIADPQSITDIEKRLAAWEERHATQLTQLRERIEQLNELRAQPPTLVVASPSPNVPDPPAPDPSPNPLPPDPAPTDIVSPSETEQLPFGTDGSPVPVTQAPVDRLALANNLFGAERYGLALEIYQHVAAEVESGTNREWVRYQIACCHRQSGNTAKAEKNYRIVAAAEDAPFLSEKARWWLDHVDKRRAANATLQRLQTALKALDPGDE